MRVTFVGFDTVLDVSGGHIEVLEVENKTLFSRICQSIVFDKREEAIEPFLYWREDGKELSKRERPIVVVDPFNLPWNDKRLLGALPSRIHEELVADGDACEELEALVRELAGRVFGLTAGMEAGYVLDVEWDTAKYLKALGLAVDLDDDSMLIDKLEEFLKLVVDARFHLPVVFVNLKSYLDEKDIRRLYKQAIVLDFPLLLLESFVDDASYDHERKHRIDLHFLEY